MNSYIFSDSTELLKKADELKNKSVREISVVLENHKVKNKNFMGDIVEEYLGLKRNSFKGPDFSNLGIELKTIPLKRNSKNALVPKERMVISMINYMDDWKYDFIDSHLYKKLKNLLIVRYENKVDKLDNVIKDVFLWKIPDDDLKVIESDYKKIQEKIISGKAHEISESDTKYLGACTKGRGKGRDYVSQYFNNNIKAKSRAYSIKHSYLNILNNVWINY